MLVPSTGPWGPVGSGGGSQPGLILDPCGLSGCRRDSEMPGVTSSHCLGSVCLILRDALEVLPSFAPKQSLVRHLLWALQAGMVFVVQSWGW